jgi:hypothetical protein
MRVFRDYLTNGEVMKNRILIFLLISSIVSQANSINSDVICVHPQQHEIEHSISFLVDGIISSYSDFMSQEELSKEQSEAAGIKVYLKSCKN